MLTPINIPKKIKIDNQAGNQTSQRFNTQLQIPVPIIKRYANPIYNKFRLKKVKYLGKKEINTEFFIILTAPNKNKKIFLIHLSRKTRIY
jgi:hypothetical protein